MATQKGVAFKTLDQAVPSQKTLAPAAVHRSGFVVFCPLFENFLHFLHLLFNQPLEAELKFEIYFEICYKFGYI